VVVKDDSSAVMSLRVLLGKFSINVEPEGRHVLKFSVPNSQ
jgi:hypothetical protein